MFLACVDVSCSLTPQRSNKSHGTHHGYVPRRPSGTAASVAGRVLGRVVVVCHSPTFRALPALEPGLSAKTHRVAVDATRRQRSSRKDLVSLPVPIIASFLGSPIAGAGVTRRCLPTERTVQRAEARHNETEVWFSSRFRPALGSLRFLFLVTDQ